MAKMTIDNKLGVNRFNVDEENCHIQVVKQHADHDEVNRVVRICPAGLYKADDDGVRFDYLGCLECGTCRILSQDKVVSQWDLPQGSFGVNFRKS